MTRAKRKSTTTKTKEKTVNLSIAELRQQRRREKKIRKRLRKEQEKIVAQKSPVPKKTSANVENLEKKRILPKEHWESTYIDGRVYIPTMDDFSGEACRKGSMLDEVSYLHAEDLASLLCGSRIFLMIRDSSIGMELLNFCIALKERHNRLNLRAVASEPLVRQHCARLLLYEDCSEEFLTITGISLFFEYILRFIVQDSFWYKGQRKEFSIQLARRLVGLQPGVALIDDSFYSKPHCSLRLNPLSVKEATKLPEYEVKKLLECLFANAMRFFVLYCMHAVRDQTVLKFSNDGSAFFRLKDPLATSAFDKEVHALGPKFHLCVSDEKMKSCMPLSDLYTPTFDDWQSGNDCSSLVYQIAHLPVAEITRLILGEKLFLELVSKFPVFVAQLNEYARSLKHSQSRERHRQCKYAMTKTEIEVLRTSVVKVYVERVLLAASDWFAFEKKVSLLNYIAKSLRTWVRHERLFKEAMYDMPYEEYHSLRVFSEKHGALHPLSEELLKEISTRFDHFFLIYAIHALREHTDAFVDEKGIVKFRFKEQDSNAYRTDILIPDEELQHRSVSPNDWSSQQSIQIVKNPGNSWVPSQADEANVLPSFKPESVKSLEIVEAENDNDEEWEMKLFERVREDPIVPAHFKTSFGILVANNRNLREEKAFLQSRLGLG
ncbi:unnamed protein product [Cylicocyclus nassatus]|uniref:Uncharacterized protein n=1 Tax=Cylicocyclus nassatus TaxID=53992 RepID=A0AA36GMJ7_CYLNA|nr:unnamed protein product [Cylicocyclus nassatus]